MTAKTYVPLWLLFVAGSACGEDRKPQTSSTSHWITCSTDDDCAGVAGAVECRSGYCVDASGERIGGSASQNGAGAGGESAGGAGEPSSGGEPTGGTSSNTGGTGASSTGGTGGAIAATGGAQSTGATGGSPDAGAAGAGAEDGGSNVGGAAGSTSTTGCPAEPPPQGSPCTPPWESELRPGVGEEVSAHCSWGDDTRRSCRTRALCEQGAWQVTSPDAELCGECPPFVPVDGEACPAAGLQCGQCSCSACAGGDGAPSCQLVDPPQWFCPELPAECPFPAAQAGSPCEVSGVECGENCFTPLRCENGVWQWFDCSACCPECAAPDTPIATPEGERPISSLSAGDLVYSVHDHAIVAVPLLRVGHKAARNHQVVRVTLSNGAVLEMSAGHPLANGGTFGSLVAGSAFDDEHVVVGAEVVPYSHAATYDILPDSSTGTYFAAGAEVSSTLFPRASAPSSSRE